MRKEQRQGSMYCIKCNRTILQRNFYKMRDGSRRYEVCKQCLTMHVNNFEPDSFTWILKELDYPYVPTIWTQIRDKIFADNPNKMAGSTVLGRYISQMRLVQWKTHGWDDSEMLEAREQEKINRAKENAYVASRASQHLGKSEEELRKEYERGDISLAEYKTYAPVEEQYNAFVAGQMPVEKHVVPDSPFHPPIYADIEMPDPSKELQQEDILYLVMKWGKKYSPDEWIELQKMYKEIQNSCENLDPDTKNTLIMICKTNLKANQSLDMGDYDSFQKLSRVLDNLRKSANLTAVQKKKDQKDGNVMSSISQMVAYLEKNGGKIPRFEITAPVDIIDKIIQDQKQYTKNLIYRDTALAKQIQDYIKRKQAVTHLLEQEEMRQEDAIEIDEEVDIHDFIASQEELMRMTQAAAALDQEATDES